MSEFEKKSERIEIRVSHSKKQAFNQACENSGDTPSSAVRRFIDSYIRRADGDAFKEGVRAMGRMMRRRWLPLGTVAALLLVGGYFTGQALKPTPQDGPIVTASTDEFPPIDYPLFAAYDKNANGVLDLGEVADNDEHLHRVLNLDGEAGISPAEFYPKTKMQWGFVKKGSVETWTDDKGLPTGKITSVGETTLLEFDLSDPNAPVLITRAPTKTVQGVKEESGKKLFGIISFRTKVKTERQESVDRGVSWEHGKASPTLSFSNHDFRVRAVTKANPS